MRYLPVIFAILMVAAPLQIHAEETERFQPVGENIVFDAETGLMWAARDNGKDIDWYEAEKYCKDFEAGGYDDWRLPDIKELASLYTKDQKNKEGFYIIEHITITDCCVWSADENMGGAEIFSYKSGKRPAGFLADNYQLRALPVRSATKEGSDDYNVVNKSGAVKK